jgi:hypothetical protein
MRELWLWIDQNGGRVTESFDPTLFPAGAVKSPGPLRVRKRSGANGETAANLNPSRSASVASTSTGDGYEYWRMDYYDYGFNVYRPVASANVTVNYYDAAANDELVKVSYHLTDANGRFAVDCATHTRSIWYEGIVDVRQYGSIKMADPNVGTFGDDFRECWGPENEIWVVASRGEPVHVRNNLIRTSDGARALFGSDYAVTGDVCYSNFDSLSSPCFDSWYDKYKNYIHIHSTDVWGNYGVWTQAHEYGHGYHHNRMGGIHDYVNWPCLSHTFDGTEDPACAYTEGTAHFMAMVTRGPDLPDDFYYKYWVRVGLTPGVHVGSDGSRVEGVVAAFLYDLVDPQGDEWFDNVQLSHGLIANLLANCQVIRGGTVMPEQGIGDVIVCLEQNANVPWYFTDLSQPSAFTGFTWSPDSQTLSAIRTLWLKVLFDRTS